MARAPREEAVAYERRCVAGEFGERIMCAKLFGVPRRVILVASVKARNLRRQIPHNANRPPGCGMPGAPPVRRNE